MLQKTSRNHLIHQYTLSTVLNMAVYKTTPTRFQMSFKKKERNFFEETENELMEELHIPTKSDLYKYSLKFLKASRTKTALAMV